MKAINKYCPKMETVLIKRKGSDYNSLFPTNNYASATAIRNMLYEGNFTEVGAYLTSEGASIINEFNAHKPDLDLFGKICVLALKNAGVERDGSSNKTPSKYTAWEFGSLNETQDTSKAGWDLKLFKALRDEGDGVTVRLFKSEDAANAEHAKGVARLLAIEVQKNSRREFRVKNLSFTAAIFFNNLKYNLKRLSDDILIKAIRSAAVDGLEKVCDEKCFSERVKDKRFLINETYSSLTALVSKIFEDASLVLDKVERADLPEDIADDINTQIAWLVYPGFVASVPMEKLKLYSRYFKALILRIERARIDKTSDRSKMARIEPYWAQYYELVTNKNAKIDNRQILAEYRWLLEEYRISLFAQEVKTLERVSPERLSRLWLSIF
jgi:ATP-dependent helicase HrpA